jgi:Na+-driven multidrug efflux pump/anti-sigma regulatory factor (Ser/Thr protein kinase)
MNDNYIIKTAIRRYMMPTVLSTVSVTLCLLIDAVMMGRMLGEFALAAGCLVFPITALINFANGCLGGGGGTLFSSYTAKGERDNAAKVFSSALLAVVVFGLILTCLGLFAMPVIAPILGARGETLQPTLAYGGLTLIGAPIIITATTLQSFLRNDNSPRQAMISVFITNIINIVLDYVFMGPLKMGAAGAAYALIIGSVCSIIYTFFIHRSFRFGRPSLKMVGSAAKTGVGGSAAFVMAILVQITCNNLLVNLVGETGPALNSVVNNVNFLGTAVFMGIAMAMQPIASTFYAEKDFQSLKTTALSFFKIAAVLSVLLAILQFAIAAPISTMFGLSGSAAAGGANALRIMSLSMLTLGLGLVLMYYYQSTERAKLSAVLALARVFIFLLPLVFILSGPMGVNGVWWGRALADMLCVVTGIVISMAIAKKEGVLPVLLVPSKSEKEEFQYMMLNNMENIVSLHEKINSYCESGGFNTRQQNAVCLVVEEMTAHICEHGFKPNTEHYIDVRIGFDADKIIIRIRDDGVLFNPLEYIAKQEQQGDSDELRLGIMLLTKISKSQQYDRIMSFNNLLVTI